VVTASWQATRSVKAERCSASNARSLPEHLGPTVANLLKSELLDRKWTRLIPYSDADC
jgi:hypothetical protein